MLRLEEYVDQLGDSRVMNALARQMRSRPEEECFQFIQELLDYPSSNHLPRWAGLRLANKCLRKRDYLEAILDKCLDSASGPFIDACLENVLPRLGYYHVVGLLTKKIMSDPSAAKATGLARYYLGSPTETDGARAVQALQELDNALHNVLSDGPSNA